MAGFSEAAACSAYRAKVIPALLGQSITTLKVCSIELNNKRNTTQHKGIDSYSWYYFIRTQSSTRVFQSKARVRMANQDPQPSAVDETPISPSRPDYHIRQNSLEKHLQTRPDPKELKE